MLEQGRASQAIPQARESADELSKSVEGLEPGTSGRQRLHTERLRVVHQWSQTGPT
jgi:hypothetical protein